MKFANISHTEEKAHLSIVKEETGVEFSKTWKRGDQVLGLAPWLHLAGPFYLPFSPFSLLVPSPHTLVSFPNKKTFP